jgi:hypothetical protein
LQSQHEYKQQQYDNTGQNKQETTKRKRNESVWSFNTQTRIPVSLHTAFSVETHLTEGQWLEEQVETHLAERQWLQEQVETHLAERQWPEEQVNMSKLRMFRVGSRRPTISRTGGQHLVPLKH